MDAGVSTAALDTLLGRVARGDAEAFGTLYDRLAPQVWAAALAVSNGPGQAEALTEQVFVDMWRHSPDARSAPGCAQGWLLARDLSIAGAAVLFSLWVTFAAGYSAVYQAMVVVLAGIIIYAFIGAHRERVGQIPAPVDLVGAVAGGENLEGKS